MKSGLVSISFRELSAQEIISLVAAHGLQGIEWGGDVHVPHGDLDRARDVGRMTRDAGLEVSSYGSYYRFAECDPNFEEEGPSFESVLETAIELGAPAIRVWGGSKGPNLMKGDEYSVFCERACEIADMAASKNVRIDFEYHENTITETPESTVELMLLLLHDNLRTLWQPPLQISPEKRLEGLKKVLPWVTNVHCNHFAQEPWPHVQPLADGEEEWKPYIQVLAQGELDRWVLIEHVKDHDPNQFPKDASALSGWLSS
jgi:sugar phosphate isomerase/epimerase